LANKKAEAGNGLTFQGPSWTGKEVYIGRNANITGNLQTHSKDLELDRDSVVHGSLLSNDDIWIGRNSTIYGDVSPGQGDSYETDPNVTITGSTDAYAKSFNTFELPDMPSAPPEGSLGNEDVEADAYSIITLTPGSYRDVSLDHDSTLNLVSGTYVLGEFWMDHHGTVNIDTTAGDVVINVQDEFVTGDYVSFLPTGTNKIFLHVFDDCWLGKDNEMRGTVRVWDGSFGADESLNFTGTVWAEKELTIGLGAIIDYSDGGMGYYGDAPEPATITILIAGGGIVLGRRRRIR
jgi:hypothetical protein